MRARGAPALCAGAPRCLEQNACQAICTVGPNEYTTGQGLQEQPNQRVSASSEKPRKKEPTKAPGIERTAMAQTQANNGATLDRSIA